MKLDQGLLNVLACPKDKGSLFYFSEDAFLYNPRLKTRYEVSNGIPVMLIEESTVVEDTEHARLLSLVESTDMKPTF